MSECFCADLIEGAIIVSKLTETGTAPSICFLELYGRTCDASSSLPQKNREPNILDLAIGRTKRSLDGTFAGHAISTLASTIEDCEAKIADEFGSKIDRPLFVGIVMQCRSTSD